MAAMLLLAIAICVLCFALVNKLKGYKTEESDSMMRQLSDINDTIADLGKVQNAHASFLEYLENISFNNSIQLSDINETITDLNKVQNDHASSLKNLENVSLDNARTIEMEKSRAEASLAIASRVDSRIASISGYTFLTNSNPSTSSRRAYIYSSGIVYISVSTNYAVSLFNIK